MIAYPIDCCNSNAIFISVFQFDKISILSFFMLQFFNGVGYSIDITFITLSSIKLFNLSSKFHHNLDVHLSISNQFHEYHVPNMRTLPILVSLTQSLCL